MKWPLVFLCSVSCVSPFEFESKASTVAVESMVFLEEGSFLMGYPDVTPGPYGNHWKVNQQPEHIVSVRSFYMDPTEVTVSDWSLFLNALYAVSPTSAASHYHPLQPLVFDGRFEADDSFASSPIRYVNWYDAATYCAWAGKRLPTESEWERAAKGLGESGRAFPWLEVGGPSCLRAVYFTNKVLCEERPVDVGSRSPMGDTPEGLMDMAGNVAEWVTDWAGPYSEEALSDPTGPVEGRYKILRGGGFRETSDAMRTRDRVPADPLSRSEGVGFRCVTSG